MLTPPSSLNAYMFGRGHVARDVNRAMMLELFVKEVGAEAASAFFAASAPLTSVVGYFGLCDHTVEGRF